MFEKRRKGPKKENDDFERDLATLEVNDLATSCTRNVPKLFMQFSRLLKAQEQQSRLDRLHQKGQLQRATSGRQMNCSCRLGSDFCISFFTHKDTMPDLVGASEGSL